MSRLCTVAVTVGAAVLLALVGCKSDDPAKGDSGLPDTTVAADGPATADGPVTPDGPVVTPDGPVVTPDGPVVNPDGPVVTPDGPVVTPDGPVVTPDGPVVTPDGPVVTPDGPVVTPDGPVVTPDGPVTPDATVAPGSIIANHFVVDQLAQIPSSYIAAAAAQKVFFRHASVGQTIDNELNKMQQANAAYDRSNWDFRSYVELASTSGAVWYGKADDFTARVPQFPGFDVYGFKYCFIDALDGAGHCGCTSSLCPNPTTLQQWWTYYKNTVETLEAANPTKKFIWVTVPLTIPGMKCGNALNALIRQHALANNKILYDIADIESHLPDGTMQTTTIGEAAYPPYCGEYCAGNPNPQACHPTNCTQPGKISDGVSRLAKAWWWMMARLSGWNP